MSGYIELADATTIRIWSDYDDGQVSFCVDACDDEDGYTEEIYDWDYSANDRILTLERAYELADAFRQEYGLADDMPVYYAGSINEELDLWS